MKHFLIICIIAFSAFNLRGEQVKLIACDNSVEMVNWGLEFIKHAEQSIEFAPCFFGGKLFQDYMLAIEKQMQTHSKLQVYMFLSPIFLEPMNKDLLSRLEQTYPRQLHIVYTITDLQFTSRELITTDNHIKMLVVDETYFTTGGTNFDDVLVSEGTKPRERRQKECTVGQVLAAGARDQDIVGRATLVARDFRHLFYKFYTLWEEYNKSANFSSKDPDSYVKNACREINLEQPLLIEKFETSPDLITLDSDQIQMVLGSPHQISNQIKEKYVELIDGAEHEIVIGNLHFAPADRIMYALQCAAKRGVKITVITNGIHDRSPTCNSFSSWPNRVSYLPLLYGQSFHIWQRYRCELKPVYNVDFYEYYVDNILYHKKVMVVDGQKFIIGSYNLALRSDLCDYEFNLVIDSKQTAQKALQILQKDQLHSIQVTHKQIKNWFFDPLAQYKAAIQRHFNIFI